MALEMWKFNSWHKRVSCCQFNCSGTRYRRNLHKIYELRHGLNHRIALSSAQLEFVLEFGVRGYVFCVLCFCLWHQLRYNFSQTRTHTHTDAQVMSVQIVCQMRFEREANVNQNVHTKQGKILPQQHKRKLDKLRCKGWGLLKMLWHWEMNMKSQAEEDEEEGEVAENIYFRKRRRRQSGEMQKVSRKLSKHSKRNEMSDSSGPGS